MRCASVAQLVEHHVANVIVAGSIPVTRSIFFAANRGKSRALPVVFAQSRTKVRSFAPPLAKRDISSRFAAKKLSATRALGGGDGG